MRRNGYLGINWWSSFSWESSHTQGSASQFPPSFIEGDAEGPLLLSEANLLDGVDGERVGRGDEGGLGLEAEFVGDVADFSDGPIGKREPKGERQLHLKNSPKSMMRTKMTEGWIPEGEVRLATEGKMLQQISKEFLTPLIFS